MTPRKSQGAARIFIVSGPGGEVGGESLAILLVFVDDECVPLRERAELVQGVAREGGSVRADELEIRVTDAYHHHGER